jgi:hypothetical protein
MVFIDFLHHYNKKGEKSMNGDERNVLFLRMITVLIFRIACEKYEKQNGEQKSFGIALIQALDESKVSCIVWHAVYCKLYSIRFDLV